MGSCRASSMIFGRMEEKKRSDSGSSNSFSKKVWRP